MADAGFAGSSLHQCDVRDAGRRLSSRYASWCECAGHRRSKTVSRPVLDTAVLRIDRAFLIAADGVALVQEITTRVRRPAQIEVAMVIALHWRIATIRVMACSKSSGTHCPSTKFVITVKSSCN